MAITNGYCTLAELKARFDVLDDQDDSILEQVIEAASRQIDSMCNRRFYAATETRYYTADDMLSLTVDDLISVTTFSTDEDGDRVWETVWDTTDYELGPANAALDGRPYTSVEPAPMGNYLFPLHSRAVKIAGSFGYSATAPDAINEATLLIAARLFKRKDAPMGAQIGNQQLGALSIPGKDPDVDRLLMPYRRFALVGV